MALLKFFKIPKHQQFEYKTRYWDPQKEELNERLKRIEERKNNSVEATKARISSGFRSKGYYHTDSSFRRRQTSRSNIILLAVIVFLVFLSYIFLTVYLPKIVQLVEKSGGAM